MGERAGGAWGEGGVCVGSPAAPCRLVSVRCVRSFICAGQAGGQARLWGLGGSLACVDSGASRAQESRAAGAQLVLLQQGGAQSVHGPGAAPCIGWVLPWGPSSGRPAPSPPLPDPPAAPAPHCPASEGSCASSGPSLIAICPNQSAAAPLVPCSATLNPSQADRTPHPTPAPPHPHPTPPTPHPSPHPSPLTPPPTPTPHPTPPRRELTLRPPLLGSSQRLLNRLHSDVYYKDMPNCQVP
jgi:hypothetical protein